NPLVQPLSAGGLFNDIKKLAMSILDDPPDTATFVALVALVGRIAYQPGSPLENIPIVRMNPLVQPVRDAAGEWRTPGWDIPPKKDRLSPEEFRKLKDLDIAAIETEEINLITKFCNEWLFGYVPNQPIRANSITFECEIGHRRFGNALARWRSFWRRGVIGICL